MFSTAQNIHHHKLPALGAIVTLPGLSRVYHPRDLWIVESFPLCDNVLPYSKGIHTANLRRLRDDKRVRVSGFYCEA